ncbi:MAG: signal recognition particle-docking protein FtsY [Alphaproteobacteria bacterium]|nr:signal recognition particle-docking protein FtsY [Alphaproteobacteria bacterium]OJV46346.1 MAG: signal recognition particle-docking protein FtsY [Alphaproteobacteria bacterium 43-37]
MSEKKGWFSKITSGLKKSTDKLSHGIGAIFTKKKLDNETLSDLEDLLITCDIGVEVTGKILASLKKTRFGEDVTDQEIKEFLASDIVKIMEPYEQEIHIESGITNVIPIIGVNGSGKTTTISKLAQLWRDQGLTLSLVAGDTFRAAAVSQLKIWGDRLGIEVVSGEENADTAALAFEALQNAQKKHVDILLIDTAGRLHNRADLMAELDKTQRALQKLDPAAPHQCIMILDATTGQNLYAQVETFKKYINVSGFIMTKLDGTAKGGVLIGLVDHFKLPVFAIGVGEKAEDLKMFNANEFAATLLGLASDDGTS